MQLKMLVMWFLDYSLSFFASGTFRIYLPSFSPSWSSELTTTFSVYFSDASEITGVIENNIAQIKMIHVIMWVKDIVRKLTQAFKASAANKIFSTRGDGGSISPHSWKFAHSSTPPRQIPPSRLPTTKFLFCPPSYNPIKIAFASVKKSHCFCTTLYSLYTQVMIILILIDVQYLQNVLFRFPKGLNHQIHSSNSPPPDKKSPHHLIKNPPQQNLSSSQTLNTIWKTVAIRICFPSNKGSRLHGGVSL